MNENSLKERMGAEFLGTLWLVLCGCGSAVLAASFEKVGIGLLGVSFAFGLSVLTMAFALGPISGAHLNPAVSFGMWAAGRFPRRDVIPYFVAQVLGGIAGAGLLYVIASGHVGFDLANGFAANGYSDHSPGGYSLFACLITEFVFTFMFLIVILGATGGRASTAFAPIAIGFALTLIHLVTIPITNTSVNPARSLGPAIFVGGWALQQVWLFWLAPLAGGGVAGLAYKALSRIERQPDSSRAMNPAPSMAPAPR